MNRHLIRLFFVIALVNLSFLLGAQESRTNTGPSAMLRDQKNATDQYAIPYDYSNIEDDELEDEMDEIEEDYERDHPAKASKKEK